MPYYRIRNVKVHDMGPTDDYYVIQTTPGRTNMSHEERVEGWLGQTNDWSAYAEGEYDTLEEAVEAIDMDIYEVADADALHLYDDETVAVYKDKRSVWSVDDWLEGPIDIEADGWVGMTAEQIADSLISEAASQDIVLTGDVAERVRELLVERDQIDARRLRERQLQEEHGLSVQESVVMAALEEGERVTDIRKRLGVSQQAVTDAKRRALIKMGEREPEA